MAVVEGMVAGVEVTSADIAGQLPAAAWAGRGARMKFEQDEVTVLARLRHGITWADRSPSRSATASGRNGKP